MATPTNDLNYLESLYEQTVREAFQATAFEDRGWRKLGSRRAAERTLEDLRIARDDTRRLLEGSEWDDGNEFAIGAAENRVNYVIGDGFTYEAVALPGSTAIPGLVAEVQAFLDSFHELNAIGEIEVETLWRCDRDGEALLRLFPGDGIPEVRFVEPERVVAPRDSNLVAPWGIHTDTADHTKRLGYFVEPEIGSEPEFVGEPEIVHIRFNSTSASLRGWPTFEPVARTLRRAEELLVAGTATNKAQAKIALIRKMANLTRDKADSIVSNLTKKYQEQPNGEAAKEVTVDQLPYGAMIRAGKDDEFVFPTASSNSSTIEMIQANLRAAGARLNMPEWMFTGVASEKYANAFVGEGPTLRSFQRIRRKLLDSLAEGRLRQRASLMWRAVRMGVSAGLLPREAITTTRIRATAPSLEVRDKGSEATTNAIYIDKGVKPVALVQQELGYDPAALAAMAKPAPAPPTPSPPTPTPPVGSATGGTVP